MAWDIRQLHTNGIELGILFSGFNRYINYESTGKQELLKKNILKTNYGNIGINYNEKIEASKKLTIQKKEVEQKATIPFKNCKRNNYKFVIKSK